MTPPFKRPRSSWMKFLNEYYEQHKPAGERVDFAEYIHEASFKWKQLSDEQKAVRIPLSLVFLPRGFSHMFKIISFF
jgi:hypothetical protein